jgi:hypothetical protein
MIVPVLNPANASTLYESYGIPGLDTSPMMYEDEIAKEALAVIRQLKPIKGYEMNEVLHGKLKDQLMETMEEIRDTMVSRFVVVLPYADMQDMLMSPGIRIAMRTAGKCMEKQYTAYEYKLGEKVTIRINCNGGKEMPAILFPNRELTMFSEEFLDLVRPLYSITKSWMDVHLAFKTVLMLIQDTRELNFFVPWLRYLFPESKDLTNEFNAQFRVTNWLTLDREKASTVSLITRQIRQILKNEYTNKRTWMPSGLVQMVRQGEELITQYNIMKTVPMPNAYAKEDQVSIQVTISNKDHPTINWAAEASSHRIMNEANRLAAVREEADKAYDNWKRKEK